MSPPLKRLTSGAASPLVRMLALRDHTKAEPPLLQNNIPCDKEAASQVNKEREGKAFQVNKDPGVPHYMQKTENWHQEHDSVAQGHKAQHDAELAHEREQRETWQREHPHDVHDPSQYQHHAHFFEQQQPERQVRRDRQRGSRGHGNGGGSSLGSRGGQGGGGGYGQSSSGVQHGGGSRRGQRVILSVPHHDGQRPRREGSRKGASRRVGAPPTRKGQRGRERRPTSPNSESPQRVDLRMVVASTVGGGGSGRDQDGRRRRDRGQGRRIGERRRGKDGGGRGGREGGRGGDGYGGGGDETTLTTLTSTTSPPIGIDDLWETASNTSSRLEDCFRRASENAQLMKMRSSDSISEIDGRRGSSRQGAGGGGSVGGGASVAGSEGSLWESSSDTSIRLANLMSGSEGGDKLFMV